LTRPRCTHEISISIRPVIGLVDMLRGYRQH